MTKGLEEVGELLRHEIERFMYAEVLHHFRMGLDEVANICDFAKTQYIKRREADAKKHNVVNTISSVDDPDDSYSKGPKKGK